MKKISTLIQDIRDRLTSTEPFDADAVKQFGTILAEKLATRLSRVADKPTLRMSNLGTRCSRKLWYSINRPEFAEPLSASTRLKFLFGDILEEVVLFLARAAGHAVTDEQREVKINGVVGHIDGLVDGELVDVKSTSHYGFAKFATHGLMEDDPFGYISQLGAYGAGLGLNRGSFLAVHKERGHIVLDTYPLPDTDYNKVVDEQRKMLEFPLPPARTFQDQKEGESGNRKLGVECAYCPFKKHCWPGLRAFKYKKGNGIKVVFLSKVVKEPNVPEISLAESEASES